MYLVFALPCAARRLAYTLSFCLRAWTISSDAHLAPSVPPVLDFSIGGFMFSAISSFFSPLHGLLRSTLWEALFPFTGGTCLNPFLVLSVKLFSRAVRSSLSRASSGLLESPGGAA